MSALIPPGFAQHQPIDAATVWPNLNEYEAQRVRAVREAVRVWCEQERAMNAAFPQAKKGMAHEAAA